MKAQHLHSRHVARAILHSVNPEVFAPKRLSAKALNDDSCWDEYDSDYDESLPLTVLNGFDDANFE